MKYRALAPVEIIVTMLVLAASSPVAAIGAGPVFSNETNYTSHVIEIVRIRAEAALTRVNNPALFGDVNGAVVIAVASGGEGEKVGIQKGDILLRYGGKDIQQDDGFTSNSTILTTSDPLILEFIRNSSLHSINVPPGKLSITIHAIKKEDQKLLPVLNEVDAGDETKLRAEISKWPALKQIQILGEFFIDLKKEAGQQNSPKNQLMANIALHHMGFISDEELLIDEAAIKLFIHDLPGAEKCYLSAYSEAERMGDYVAKGEAIHGLANIDLNRGDAFNALERYSEAEVIFRKANFPRGVAKSLISQGMVLTVTGRFGEALKKYEDSISISIKSNLIASTAANAYVGCGHIYELLGELDLASDEYEKAKELFQKSDFPVYLGAVLTSLGEVAFAKEEYDIAQHYFLEALENYSKARLHAGMGFVQIYLGDIFLKKESFDKAREMYEAALTHLVAENAHRHVPYLGLGDYYSAMGDREKAIECYEKARRGFELTHNIGDEITTITHEVKVSDKDKSLELYINAISKLEQVRKGILIPDYKKSYLNKGIGTYRDASLFMIEQKQDQLAFQYTEGMKARLFLDSLSEGVENVEKGIEPGLKKKRDDLEFRLAGLYRARNESINLPDDYSSENEKIIEKIKAAEKELNDVIKEIRFSNPVYSSIRYTEPVNVSELQKILQKDEIALEYLTGEKSSFCFVISSEKLDLIRLPVDKKELDSMVKEILVTFQQTATSGNLQKFSQRLAISLYGSLIKPLESHLTGKKVIIIPDDILAKLPFELLLDDDSAEPLFLIQKYRVSYVQSATIFKLLRDNYKQKVASDDFLGLGDPVYDFESFKAGKEEVSLSGKQKGTPELAQIIRSGYLRSGKLSRLKASQEEVKAVASLFRQTEKHAKVLLRLEAREEYVKSKDISDYGFIHFSTHGLLGDNFQAMALSQIPDAKEDGFLTVEELMNCRFNAKLVVLSACDTGLGKIEEGEGITGLTRAVMLAGSPAVVASLWDVDDRGTKELMVRFYENILKKGMNKEDALREAKLALISSEKYRDPFFWSAFVMYGE